MVTVILQLFLSHALAKNILLVQQVNPRGVEQVGITVDGEKAQLTTNSNFLWTSRKFSLGVFTKIADSGMKQTFLEAKKPKNQPIPSVIPENIKVIWNQVEIVNYQQRKFWIQFAKKQLQDSAWKLQEGETVDLNLLQKNCKNRQQNICKTELGFIHL